MKRLILMRHAKTEPWTEGVDDHARALTPSGHKAALHMALEIKEMGWAPDLALVSTARRTRETSSHIKSVIEACDLMFEEGLYLAGERGISDLISEHESAETLLIIGHNPGMHDLALSLMRASGSADHRAAIKLASKLPTGACALYEAEEDGTFLPVHFVLQAFLRPKDVLS